MKKTFLLAIIFVSITGILTSCVTKQKYLELEKKYTECVDDKQFANNELLDSQNKNKDLTKEVTQCKEKIDQLKKDTLNLAHKLAQSERDYAKMKKDYDNLAKDITKLSQTSNATISELSGDLVDAQSELSAKEIELNQLQEQLEKQAAELQAKEDSLSKYAANLEELQKILNQKDKEVRNLKEKVSNALKSFEGSGLVVEQRNGKVYVSMDEKLLFASGSWTVQGTGKEAIKQLAKVLETDENINVLIEGHTDNVPYKGNGQVKDNWDLSVMRATSVVKLLLASGNINPQHISASGRSEYAPVDTDNTSAARAKNRRTEIILTPKLDELFQIIDNN